MKFYVSDEKGGSICIKGVGQLIGDVFELQHTHTKNSLGFFKTLYGLICWFTESFFHYNIFRGRYIYRSSSYKRRPLILGPVIGTINYIITLITKSYVIVKCKVVNGELVGQLIAESKGELVNHYGNKIHI